MRVQSMKLVALALTIVGLLGPLVRVGGEPRRSNAQTGTGWVKYEKNPVLGGALGTCFDITVVREAGTYRMWFSWRPKRSIALSESGDGLTWSEPVIALGPE